MAEGGLAKSPSYERQNTEDVTDLPLKLPVSSIYEHFQCPICMSRIENASLTPCGHRYCFKCIEEWINRRHECACCKAKTNVDELVSDHGFDALIRVVREERMKAEKEYYKQLVDAATNAPFEGQAKKVGSPLEAVLHKHLKQSLGLHESYHQQLILDYQRGMAKAAQEKHLQADRAMREFPHDPDHPGRVARLAEADERFEARKALLGEELERVERLLAAAYDRYLTEFLPSPSTVPLTVKLSVPERGFIAKEVLLKPDDSMGVVLKKLRGLMEEKGLQIVEFPACDEFEISIISPFAPVDEEDPSDECCGSGSHGDDDELCGKEGPRMSLTNQVLQPDCRPVLEFGIKPGTELRFKGKIVLEGEAPKFCFAATFVSGQSLAMDYFTCKQCNFNWVCKPCSECCHRGHEMVPYVMGHKPTWACCYCPRKKMCQIQLS